MRHLLFHEYTFKISLCRVGRSDVNPASANHPLPKMKELMKWDGSTWAIENSPDDGYSLHCRWSPQNPNSRFLKLNPPMHALEKELLINYSTGSSEPTKNFFSVDSVDLKETESVRRLTFCQDQSLESKDYRNLKFGIFDALLNTLAVPQEYPANLKHFQGPILGLYPRGFNLYSGYGDYAFVCHIGTENEAAAKRTFSSIESILGTIYSRKICIWFSELGQLNKYFSEDYSILSSSEKMIDITKESGDEL